MQARDVLVYTVATLRAYKGRTGLILIAMAIGVSSVMVLVSLGEGARRYVLNEFASLGSHLLIVLPGRTETAGGSAALFIGRTPRDMTIDDAHALLHSPVIEKVAPLALGSAQVSSKGLEREVVVYGSNSDLLDIRGWQMSQGRFLPADDIHNVRFVCVIGKTLKKDLFGSKNAIGEWLRVGDRRFRVIGVLSAEGESIGINTDDVVIIPVMSAQMLFNSPSLFRILVEARSREQMPAAKTAIINTIKARHQGVEDVTVITQDAVLGTFDRILKSLTYTVTGIGAISLAVAGILIMNVMLVAVSQRTREIGLLKALGATSRQVILLFLSEAALLSLMGACLGLLMGDIGIRLIDYFYPVLMLTTPLWAVMAAFALALTTGLVFGVLPARKAAALDPVQALSSR